MDALLTTKGPVIERYDESMADAWDALVSRSDHGTFLHARKFLSYHGSRFDDRSLVFLENGQLKAIFPAAVLPNDRQTICSHPGSTFGGLIHDGSIIGDQMIECINQIVEFYKGKLGFQRLIYKAIPWIYHAKPQQDDIYALFTLDAQKTVCDLSATIVLPDWSEESIKRKPEIIRASKSDCHLDIGTNYIDSFWQVLSECLRMRHNADPVHSLAEMKMLISKFPDEIELVTCSIDNRVVAGALLFLHKTVSHLQYLASSETGRKHGAINLVISRCIQHALANGKRYFDFGTSTQNSGHILNSGLYRFKSDFGAGGTVYETFQL